MSHYGQLVAGENIYLEKRGDDTIIHCPNMRIPQRNLHSGYFQLRLNPRGKEKPQLIISNCVFRLNGRNQKLDDYIFIEPYDRYVMVYLCLSYGGRPCIISESYNLGEESYDHTEDNNYILLYRITSKHSENVERFAVEPFAAGGLIDTIYGDEGFLYLLKDGSIKTTITQTASGREKYFYNDRISMYIPCFNPVTGEGMNIRLPLDKGGVLEIGKGNDCYVWRSTGYPTTSQAFGKTVSVNISINSVYFS